ncbi:hypothetical protein AQS8620_00145 [Aquimixticola soesokkakensis]|uniref:HemY N-terminal domain-containing protein n=1 Tax=Aquimixticola soesokkakensis TaxID=1519096 RepID=A0A1Y5R9S0_9RHOB|nr:heme biosynthesis HemY N-terminal domain-containing protein [Aquimixticola soesokkakensis]SLN12364.1 hypothetical protein AQS8620_00145 [Aquimixticola soesokkakensis]
MLWSLIKIILFVVIVAALAFGGGSLLEMDGGIRIVLPNVELNLGPLEAVIGLVLLIAALWVVAKLVGLLVAFVRFLLGDETALSRYFDRNRERRGFQALTDAMMALASGEGKTALAKAQKAERYLGRPEITTVVAAQAAEMSGDKSKAEGFYKRLLQDDRTRFVGVRGIMKQRLDAGDTDTALKLAEKAFALKPKHAETQDVLLKLQAEKHDWAGARKTLAAKAKFGQLPKDVHKRRDAVLALSEAAELISDDSSITQREAAIDANKMSPDLIPAAVMAARSYIKQDNPKYATRVLKKAWAAQPHPDLAAAFAEIKPGEEPHARLKRFATLTKVRPEHSETKMLLAELNIAAGEFPPARRALSDLPETDPTARVLTLMAAIERGEGADDVVVRGWLARALTASRGPQWICDNCQTIHTQWGPMCSNCGGFDTLSWRRPTQGEVAMPAGTEMLPLIVGAGVATPSVVPQEDAVAPEIIDIPDAEVSEPEDKPAP